MKRLAILISCVALALCARAQTQTNTLISATWNFNNYFGGNPNVTRLVLKPIEPYMKLANGTYLVPPEQDFTIANDPGITNGYVTTNVYTGCLYKAIVSGPGFQMAKTNYFPLCLASNSTPYFAAQWDVEYVLTYQNVFLGVFYNGFNFFNPTNGLYLENVPLTALQSGGATNGQGLGYNGQFWVPTNFSSSGGSVFNGNSNQFTAVGGLTSIANPATVTNLTIDGTAIASQFVGPLDGNSIGFTGSIFGDVTGTQGATVVSSVDAAPLPAAQIIGTIPEAALVNTLAGSATVTITPSGNTLVFTANSGGGSTFAFNLNQFTGGAVSTNIANGVTLTNANNYGQPTFWGSAFFTNGNLALLVTNGAVLEYSNSVLIMSMTNGYVYAIGAVFSGNVTAGSFTGPLVGNVTGNVTGSVSGSAATFTGNLGGDVTGPMGATVVNSIGAASVSGSAIVGSISASVLPSALQTLNTNNGAALTNLNPSAIGLGNLFASIITNTPITNSPYLSVTGATTLNNAVADGTFTVDGLFTAGDGANISGLVTATEFNGSGADLVSLPASQLVGAVPIGNLTNFIFYLTNTVPGFSPGYVLQGSGTSPTYLQWINTNNFGGSNSGGSSTITITNVVAGGVGTFNGYGSNQILTAYAYASNEIFVSYYSTNNAVNSVVGYSNIVSGASFTAFSGDPTDTNKFSWAIVAPVTYTVSGGGGGGGGPLNFATNNFQFVLTNYNQGFIVAGVSSSNVFLTNGNCVISNGVVVATNWNGNSTIAGTMTAGAFSGSGTANGSITLVNSLTGASNTINGNAYNGNAAGLTNTPVAGLVGATNYPDTNAGDIIISSPNGAPYFISLGLHTNQAQTYTNTSPSLYATPFPIPSNTVATFDDYISAIGVTNTAYFHAQAQVRNVAGTLSVAWWTNVFGEELTNARTALWSNYYTVSSQTYTPTFTGDSNETIQVNEWGSIILTPIPVEDYGPCTIVTYQAPGQPSSGLGGYTNTTGLQFGNGSSDIYASTMIVASNTATLCTVNAQLYLTGSPSGTVICTIWNDAGANNTPGAILSGGTSTAVAAASVAGTAFNNAPYVSFTGLSASLVANTPYHIAFSCSQSPSSGNYFNLQWTGNQNNTGTNCTATVGQVWNVGLHGAGIVQLIHQ